MLLVSRTLSIFYPHHDLNDFNLEENRRLNFRGFFCKIFAKKMQMIERKKRR
jgi:hypothetical protein